ncbi:MAG: uracil-DNA glycosylase [Trueperaceae bacterium]|nr:uracil-DNA glycosylase [Trueperaceae bacterium]
MTSWSAHERLPSELERCTACPRLVEHREAVATRKRAAYRDEPYWGRPVPGFGDPEARLVLLGLAPGAHGSNRTGRQFTGDASGSVLFPALHRAGLADRPRSLSRGDGLRLRGVWITAAVRCVPPGNKPTRDEAARCRPWLVGDLGALPRLRVVLALGAFAHDAYLELVKARGARLVKARHRFAHGEVHRLDEAYPEVAALPLIDGYHVSFQNTNTGVLTEPMLDAVLAEAKALAGLS